MRKRTTASSNWLRVWNERLKSGSPTSSYLVAKPARRGRLLLRSRQRNPWAYYTNRRDGGPYERIRTNSSRNWNMNDNQRETLVRQTEEGIQIINERLNDMENSQHMQYIADARIKGASGQELDEMLTHLEAGNKGLAADVLKQVEARQPQEAESPVDSNPNAALQVQPEPEPDKILIPHDPDLQNLMAYENMTVAQLIASDAPEQVKRARLDSSWDRLQEEANQTVEAEAAAKVAQREEKYGEEAAKHNDATAAWKAAGSPPSGELYKAARAAQDARWNLRG